MLAGVVVLLGILLLVLLGGVGRGTRWAPPRTLPALPSADRAYLPQATPLQQFSVVWDKPLFNPDRKPVAHASEGGSNLGDLELTGIIITSRLGTALAAAGDGYELDAIAACFIGGAAVTGGIGRISGAIVGALIMGVLNQGLSIMNVDPSWTKVIKGLVLLLAVAYDLVSKRRAGTQ